MDAGIFFSAIQIGDFPAIFQRIFLKLEKSEFRCFQIGAVPIQASDFCKQTDKI